MNTFRTILAETFHLFVDDGSLALGLIACYAVIGVATLLLHSLQLVAGPILFVGCVAILIGNVAAAARQPKRP